MNVYRNGGAERCTVPEKERARPPSPLPRPSGEERVERPPFPGAPPGGEAKTAAGNGENHRDARSGAGCAAGERKQPPPMGREPCREKKTPPGALRDPKRSLDGVLARLDPGRWETQDLLIMAILWLLYRESGDRELLLALGAYLFL